MEILFFLIAAVVVGGIAIGMAGSEEEVPPVATQLNGNPLQSFSEQVRRSDGSGWSRAATYDTTRVVSPQYDTTSNPGFQSRDQEADATMSAPSGPSSSSGLIGARQPIAGASQSAPSSSGSAASAEPEELAGPAAVHCVELRGLAAQIDGREVPVWPLHQPPNAVFTFARDCGAKAIRYEWLVGQTPGPDGVVVLESPPCCSTWKNLGAIVMPGNRLIIDEPAMPDYIGIAAESGEWDVHFDDRIRNGRFGVDFVRKV